MAITDFYSHGTIRRCVTAFATLFNGYKVRKTDGTLVMVPLRWSSKQKWHTKYQEDNTGAPNTFVSITWPRMGFTIANISYNFERKVSSLNKISAANTLDAGSMLRTYSAAPYTIDFDLFIGTRTIDEGLQLIEQIIPFFTPSFNITISELDTLGLERDVPIRLNSVQPNLDIEGMFDGDDVKLWDLSFSMEVNLYKNIKSEKIIKKIIVDTYPSTDVTEETIKFRTKYTVDPETAFITDEYSILEEIGYVSYDTPKLPA